MDELINVTHLTFTYPHASAPTLRDINLKIYPGDFLVIAGASGSGKTTLLSHLKKELAPHGQRQGRVLVNQQDIFQMAQLQSAQTIGYVSQNPRNQPVMATVIEELAFSLENIGCPSAEINRRLAELSNYLGLDQWLHQPLRELSGGQLQIVNLAAVLTLRPQVILLDEPTAQLDPLMTQTFMAILARLHDELGLTIIMTEHNLAGPLTLASRMILLAQQTIATDGPVDQVVAKMFDQPALSRFVPEVPALFLSCYPQLKPVPLAVGTGKRQIQARQLQFRAAGDLTSPNEAAPAAPPILTMRHVSFSFDQQSLIVDHQNLTLAKGDWLTIVGKNGSGKSTLLSLLAGLRKPPHGKIRLAGQILWRLPNLKRIQQLSFLSQDPSLQFGNPTVLQELTAQGDQLGLTDPTGRAEELLRTFHLTQLKDHNPFDLSGGQQRLLGLAIALLARPKVLILDEPTNGLDPNTKFYVGRLLKTYQQRGGTIVMATHDMAFAANFSTTCSFMFDHRVETILPRRQFFAQNSFFTTAVNRLVGDQVPSAVLVSDVRATKEATT
ncbi:ABC transporter ATP-binding protein [Lentilactobacillus farraginis]|uniref:Metal ion ABC superfamily ATP binding cassette transporter ATPase n=1 Tax=Lentilactobacillus farraginis DSM 18382 = JCM 14108 TaxID=1423743 RepID=A0A0R1W307_9LACO|nr:ABC transporter ATP-binding protein [Lentilactobacillus farraginis]KRM08812.1 metal ion ABC superfamily ATP binding cassette transporter ATPase [Lentilactobacillus farraginis DSM 18382 = JCM 14108]